MIVARYYNNKDVRIEELPVPVIGPGEILVKVLSSGICGTDVMEWYRAPKGPRILGHEISGEIGRVAHLPGIRCHWQIDDGTGIGQPTGE